MALLSPAVLGLGLLAAALAYLARCAASPLARLPGPSASLFTSWVLRWHEFHGRRTAYVHGLHRRYGPAVRLAPDEASFASPAAVREIYASGGSGYAKTEFYDLFAVYGRRTMFASLSRQEHAGKRRMLADRYANSNILKPESLRGIEARSGNVVGRCRASVGGSLDLYTTLHSYAFDCVSHHLFHPYGSNSIQDEHDHAIMLEVTGDSSLQNRLVKHHWPNLYKVLGRALALLARPRETPLADSFVRDAVGKDSTAPFTLLSHLRKKNPTPDDEVTIAAECLDHMAAGIDTTGDALCFLMWELSQPRSLHHQARLGAELRANPGAHFDRLPFLGAVVEEGLRCFPAIPMSLPRYTPEGGSVIDGFSIPEHTIVSCQAYSVNRINDSVFPDPDRFDPDRWLSPEGDAERKRVSFTFSAGGRACVGKHLALAEMKILLRDIYSTYRTLPDPEMRDEDMEMSDQLISSRPKGRRCLLRFLPADGDTTPEFLGRGL